MSLHKVKRFVNASAIIAGSKKNPQNPKVANSPIMAKNIIN
ncbi:MAG: hypothetical protein ACEQSQ_00285 [Candidatus Paceibacteria bacterium]